MTDVMLSLRARSFRVLLISTYDLGHQPFGLASPAAWLGSTGADVTCLDLAVQQLSEPSVLHADLVALYAPMHTATRMAAALLPRLRRLNPRAHICVYGLYAPMNADHLLASGADSIIGGEFEQPLTGLVRGLMSGGPPPETDGRSVVSLDRQEFKLPDRTGLQPLDGYAGLEQPDGRLKVSGYTEATRGCLHRCRHCPVVPVYEGRIRVVQADVVAGDIRQQVQAGATHITFGDPDFFNAPGHAIRVVEALHDEFPSLTYDVTIKIEHLLRYQHHLATLHDTGCILVTSAVEAFDEEILRIFDKNHSLADFEKAVDLLRTAGIALNPTFVAFTPWTTADLYVDFLTTIHRLGLIGSVAPVQYAIRLLIPRGSKLLDLEDAPFLREFDPDALCYRWENPDPAMDELQADLLSMVADTVEASGDRTIVFEQIRQRVLLVAAGAGRRRLEALGEAEVLRIPQLTEPWYCCAEPIGLAPSPVEQF